MSTQKVQIGPAHILIGDPTVVDGTSMVDLGSMESVSFDPGTQMTGVQDAFTGDAFDAESIYSVAPAPTAEVELYDASIDKLAAMLLGATKTADTLGFGEPGLKAIEDVPTLAIIPAFEAGDGVDAPHGLWMPAAMVESLASLVYNRPTGGDNSANSYTVTFRAARRRTDQDATAIPAEAQMAFMGKPSDLSLTWHLPALG
jgi:hypothetical protein